MKQGVVLITGISGGIGRALGAAFNDAGLEVVGMDRRPPPRATDNFIEADLDALCRDASMRRRTLAAVRRQLRRRPLRAIVHNAATQIVKPFARLSTRDWEETLNVNLMSVVLLTQSLQKELEAAGGCVINISSIHARLTKRGFSAYATSKAALAGLTRSLAIEFGGRIRVNSICPAAIDTPMLRAGFNRWPVAVKRLAALHPSGRIGTSAEVAALAVFLASNQAAFINGADYLIDGGIGGQLCDPSTGAGA